MRIAVTGTHGIGKSTLIDDFVTVLDDYESVPEPYWLLARNGAPSADGPTIASFEEQLKQSCKLIIEDVSVRNVIFDRCPLDFLSYLDVVSAREGFEWLPSGRLLTDIGKSLAALNLIVFVPLLRPDEIAGPIEYPELRRAVDRRLKAMLRQDDLGLLHGGLRLLEISGTRSQRVTRFVDAIRGA
jgi:hypothetical protein